MISVRCQLQGRGGIKQLERIGPYLVIANRQLYEMGESHRYTLVHEVERSVHSAHGSLHAAVVCAQKHTL